ncbi:hypothetical protein GPECTOR_3g360 [Gonium pectorale]|uniref:Uncharacterized protein n=1 Tax=Gonium pectorale TaxID=33097 RepID=A0A150H019_GONPE|nr:hypothetical protein GPECTOR_3g360 [Gonium pectorale]|eukprot:KXZ55218.1 hypothetical protein GPECTOR_3g360 [Gonium pectorale]
MAQQQPASEPAWRDHWSFRVWPQLLPELAEHIVSYLDQIDIAATFRQVNKAAAEHFGGPQHVTIRLAEPVPPHAFAAQWLAPDAARGLALERRKKLVRLVAASGVLPNIEVALQAAGFVGAARAAFGAAAGAGQLSMCQWLRDYSLRTADPHDALRVDEAMRAAAGGGHRHVCEWLLLIDPRALRSMIISVAARGGHWELAEWLIQQRLPGERDSYMPDVAYGCDLSALQRALARYRQTDIGMADMVWQRGLLCEAAGSPTPDWAAKVEEQGCPRTHSTARAAAELPDDSKALARLTWLRGRGYQASYTVASDVAPKAARAGHLHVLAWLLDEHGAEPVGQLLNPALFAAAAASGSVEVMAWLRQRGCPWGRGAYSGAAEAGCEAALEWLVEQGCPMEEGGQPYIEACSNGDLATLSCLRRLGVPWGPTGEVFLGAASSEPNPALLHLLRWLLQQGCPVKYEAAKKRLMLSRGVRSRWVTEVLHLLAENQQQQQPP